MKKLRLKIPPPIVALICGLMIWGLYAALPVYTAGAEIRQDMALLLLVLAIMIDLGALLRFKKAGTSIDPRHPHKASTIVAGGIYAYTRNPMYLGLTLILSSLCIWLGTAFGAAVLIAFIFYMNRFQIKAEEDALEAQFGEAYIAYKNNVRRWI